jgi:hypothetical protein
LLPLAEYLNNSTLQSIDSNDHAGGDHTQSAVVEEPKVEFKWLEARLVGSDTVVFRLEDGATVKVKIDIDRAGVAINFTNPDGTPRYNIGTSVKLNVIPPNKKFSVPKSQLGPSPVKPLQKGSPMVS